MTPTAAPARAPARAAAATLTPATFRAVLAEIGPRFAARAAEHDRLGTFVMGNFEVLRARKAFSAGVPEELGGGGLSHAEVCEMLRILGRYCGATALALSMHQHLVAAAVWRWRHGQPGEALLRRIAAEELVLVSTGASDWLGSNGTLRRVDGGYRFTATKICCSGSPAGHLMLTSGVLEDGEDGPEVLHFAVPFDSEGVRCENDWNTLGMRATGSHTWQLRDVFVPEAAIALRRPQQGWHPSWSVVLAVATPLIMAAYVGVTEAACELARGLVARRRGGFQPFEAVGEMETQLAQARIGLESLVAVAADYGFEAHLDRANDALMRKTLVVRACLAALDAAMCVGGGATFARAVGFERLFRDVQGCRFHPLPEAKQLLFTGRHALGLSPVVA